MASSLDAHYQHASKIRHPKFTHIVVTPCTEYVKPIVSVSHKMLLHLAFRLELLRTHHAEYRHSESRIGLRNLLRDTLLHVIY